MGKRKYKYPCIECKENCGKNTSSIECSVCSQWIHRRCVPLTYEQLERWEGNLHFVCRMCCIAVSGSYRTDASIQRFRTDACAVRAESEQLLLDTYGVHVPSSKPALASDHAVDNVSLQILKRYHPVLLETHKPLSVTGDGNCLFRAVSLALYGNEEQHKLLRLLTAIEMVMNRQYYDHASSDYTDLFNDNRLVFDSFNIELNDVLKDGGHCGLLAISALSAALGVPIQSYCPPTTGAYFLAEPLSREIRGRGVSQKKKSECTIMWSTSYVPQEVKDFRPNHFVVLVDERQCDIVDLTKGDNNDDTCVNGDNDFDGNDNMEGEEKGDERQCDIVDLTKGDNNDDTCVNGDNDFDGNDNMEGEEKGDDVENTDLTKGGDNDDTSVNGNTDDNDSMGEYTDDALDDGDDKKEEDDEDEKGDDEMDNVYDALDDDDDDDDYNNDKHVTENTKNVKNAGQLLPHNTFLDLFELMATLKKQPVSSLNEVPCGAKNNVYFVVDNEENTKRRREGKHSQFWDDRGAWNLKGTTNKTFLLERDNGEFKTVVMKENRYCIKKQKNKEIFYDQLQPQPSNSNITVLHRYYTKHSCSPNYEKRVSWLEGSNSPKIAVYEYKGTSPQTRPHGSAKSNLCSEYVRIRPEALTKMKEDLKSKTPAEVYRKVDDLCGQRNKKQVYNAKAALRKDENPFRKANFADQITGVEELQHKMPFINLIIRQSQKVPCVILYSDEQISDLKRCCCPPLSADSTVLGIDKTFNLSELHVTTTVFRNISVVKRDSGEHPIFVGPIFLHGNSDHDTFFLFFHHLAGVLCQEPTPPTLGSDEEAAMVHAIEKAFPKSDRLSCSRHLQNNLKSYLADKVGLSKKDRNVIVKSVFEMVDTTIEYTELSDRLEIYAESMSPHVCTYLKRKIIPHLVGNVRACERPGLANVHPLWTNNNSESYNHCLKQATQWKSLKLVELVLKIEELVKAQYRELKRAMVGHGNFKLDDKFANNLVPRDEWYAMDAKKTHKLFKRFLNSPKDSSTMVRSSQESRSVLLPSHGGKKPGQRKRKRAEKTTTSQTKRQRTN